MKKRKHKGWSIRVVKASLGAVTAVNVTHKWQREGHVDTCINGCSSKVVILNTKVAGKAESRNRGKVLCPKRGKFWGCALIKGRTDGQSLWGGYKRQSPGTTYSTCILSIMANRSEVWGRELTQIQKGTWVFVSCVDIAVHTHPSSLPIVKNWLCGLKTSSWNLWHLLILQFTMTAIPNASLTPLDAGLTEDALSRRTVLPLLEDKHTVNK